MARKKQQPDAWAHEVIQAPRADLPEHRQVRRMKTVRAYLWFSSLACFPLLVLILVLLGNSAAPPVTADDSTAGNLTADQAQARAVAMDTVEEWLNTTPSPLPTGRLLAWDGSSSVPAIGETTDGRTPEEMGWPDIEVHRMSVITASGALYSAEVSVQTTPAGAVPLSSPSLIPHAPTPSAESSTAPWPGAAPVQPSSNVVDAVAAWARAYTSGDPAQLRLVTGDEDSAHAYVPMPAVELVGASIKTAAPAPGATTLRDGRQVPADRLLVRAALEIGWPGQPSSQSSRQEVVYDLLVLGAHTGSPRVAAWGGPGSGPTLEEYGNAVTGVTITPKDASDVVDPRDVEQAETAREVAPSSPGVEGGA